MAKDWITGAVKHPGAFSAKAKRAGESTGAYASQEAHAPGVLGHQARLAQTLMGLPHHEGGIVADPEKPSRWQVLLDRLMGRQALQQAAGGSQANPTPPPNQDISVVRKAAEEAAARMEAEKKAKSVKLYACGGVAAFMGKETTRTPQNWRYGR